MAINTNQQEYMCVSVSACVRMYICFPSLHAHASCILSIGMCMLCVSVQFSDLELMFFSLCFSLRKGERRC